MKIYGIDVSHHQGTINWEKTASELRRVNGGNSPGFAILRVGYSARHGKGGLYTDGQFLNNVAGCEKYGVPMGVYWYCYDTTAEAARITAQQVIKMLTGHKFDYPIYFDVEYGTHDGTASGYKYNSTANRANNTALIQAALEELEKAGYYAAVYCSRDFFLNYTNLGQLADFDKWEAAYTSSDTSAVQNGLWQYSSSNALGIAGFGKSLDCDVSYKDYPAIMRKNGLNGYESQEAPADQETEEGQEQQQTPTIGPMSRGDFDRVVNQAAALGKAPMEYTVRFEAMTTATASKLQATAKELNVKYKSDWA